VRHRSPLADGGSITLFAVVLFLAILVAVGLVADGGAKLRAARQASDTAEEAARAGAGLINRDRAYSRGGTFLIDQTAALQAARTYLTTHGVKGTVTPVGTEKMRVTVTISRPAPLLSLIGISTVSATKTATADLVQGISTPGQ
jgi:Flp pilus assembly protein TadG